ncbi:MAG: hypothetical protein Q4P33_07285 [Flaviflexus sp.]|nr:hypothetical protein [Flaviflexus sp.]
MADELTLAPLPRRLVALVIDWVAAMAIARGFLNYQPFEILGVFLVMSIVLVGTMGGTIGHFLTGIAVRRMGGGLPGPLKAVGRQALLCLVVPGIFTVADGRGFHDALMGTTITRVR